jgi:hypothetical protein
MAVMAVETAAERAALPDGSGITAHPAYPANPADDAFSFAYGNLKPRQIVSSGLYWFIVNHE